MKTQTVLACVVSLGLLQTCSSEVEIIDVKNQDGNAITPAETTANAGSDAPSVMKGLMKGTMKDEMSKAMGSERNPEKNAYFGDLHVHTVYSFDAFIFGAIASPDEAYEFAKGAALRHPDGFDMQLKAPLGFYAVSDQGFYLGALKAMTDPESKLAKLEVAKHG